MLILLALLAWLPQHDGPSGPCPCVSGARIAEAPSIDGALTEAVWTDASFATSFVQKQPVEGAAPSSATRVAFAYDESYLYIAARMEAAAEVVAPTTRRDRTGRAEHLIVSLDTFNDDRTAYSFGVTAAGVRIDYFHPSDHEHARDYSFDPVWTARTRLTDSGWTAEMRIPLSQLRFDENGRDSWGLNVTRIIPALNETDYWTLIPAEETGWASRFGTLSELDAIDASRPIEVVPYVAGNAILRNDARADELNPTRSGDLRVGGDITVGIGSNLTLTGTINPDFGQVEADPANVNLSAYETFFSERRPFFTAGKQYLEGGSISGRSRYFYSRRIGGAPAYYPDGDAVDAPSNTTILGAAKLTGRLPSGLSVGALAAATGAENARVYFDEDRHTDRVRVAAPAAFAVTRLEQQFGANNSTVGLIATGTHNSADFESPLADLQPRTAITSALDWNLRFRGGDYSIVGDVGFSHVRGTREAIVDLQRSSIHYFQRPSSDYLGVDSTRTSMTGFRGGLRANKEAGSWLWNVGTNVISPGFDLNTLGRLRRADEVNPWFRIEYRETDQTRLFQSYDFSLSSDNYWTLGGTRFGSGMNFSADFTWRNFWRTRFEAGLSPRNYDDRATRGGVLLLTPAEARSSFYMRGNPAYRLTWQTDLYGGRDELDGGWAGAGLRLAYDSGSWWSLSVRPRYDYSVTPRQYVSTLDELTSGPRAIFGRLTRHTVSTSFRLDMAFAPGLTLEMYAEPFAASGTYADYGRLERGKSFDLVSLEDVERTDESVSGTLSGEPVQFDRPDFDRLSFNSNVVLRWQWRPGSTIFLVWQQQRSRFGLPDEPASPAALAETIRQDGLNFLSFKMTYWLPVG